MCSTNHSEQQAFVCERTSSIYKLTLRIRCNFIFEGLGTHQTPDGSSAIEIDHRITASRIHFHARCTQLRVLGFLAGADW